MGVPIDGLPADEMEVVVDDWRLSHARRRSRLVEQGMPLESDQRAGNYGRRERVFALLARSTLAVQATAERRRVELHDAMARTVNEQFQATLAPSFAQGSTTLQKHSTGW